MDLNDLKSEPKGAYSTCPECGSTEIEEIPVVYLDNLVCERKIVCQSCKDVIGYWAYGYYMHDDYHASN